jgi:uncharacterized protein YbbC (DUF1343 family)
VIWEGTNLSEGRGTCRPFEIFGAPYLDTERIKKRLAPEAAEGCYFQKYSFRPTFNKWEGELCHGFMIHVLDTRIFRPFFTSIAFLRTVMELHGESFEWRMPPYEYEYEKKPIDLIVGNSLFRRDLELCTDLSLIKEKWLSDSTSFVQWRRPYLLYT